MFDDSEYVGLGQFKLEAEEPSTPAEIKDYDKILDEELARIGLTHSYFIHTDSLFGYDWAEGHVIEKIQTKKILWVPRKSRILVATIEGEAKCAYPFHQSQGRFGYNYSGLDIKLIEPVYGFLLRSAIEGLESRLEELVHIRNIN